MQKAPQKSARYLVAGIGLLTIFAIIAYLVFSKTTQSLDGQLALWINSNASPSVTPLMDWASLYGREYVWIGLVGVMLIFGKRNTKLLAVELAALFVVGIITGELLKAVAMRERPFQTISAIVVRGLPPEYDSSFPSGHALIVSIGAVFALLKFKPGKKSRVVALLLTLEALIVSYSRIYVGLHYPLDVAAGWALGSAIVLLGAYIIERYLPKIFNSIARSIESILKRLRFPEAL